MGDPGASAGDALTLDSGGGAPDPPPTPVRFGRRLGHYEFVAELGRGGMGVVYRARHCDSGTEVALKVLIAGQDATEEQLKRFEREAVIAKQLADHPGIVGVRDAGLDGGRAWFAMDLVVGRGLDDELAARECSFREIAAWLEGAARAVHFAHARGVLHRDLKPANILLAKAGDRRPEAGGELAARSAAGSDLQPPASSLQPLVSRVADFGLARMQTLDASASRLTGSGQILGTPAYMSPEQAEGAKACDARSDVYSLGATLYEALVGEPPFLGDTVYAVLARVLRDDPVPPRRRRHDVPRDLDTITLKCLEKRPEQRYPTAEALADDLKRWLDGQPIDARPLGLAHRTGRQLARRKALVAATVAAGLAALAGVGYWIARGQAAAAREAAATARAQMHAQLRDKAQDLLNAALDMRRAGLVDRMAPYLTKTEAACREAMAALSDAPEPHYHLGRMYRAQMKDAEALAQQELALAKDHEFGPARYERVVLCASALRGRLERLEMIDSQRLGERLVSMDGPHLGPIPARSSRRALATTDPEARRLLRGITADLELLDRRSAADPAASRAALAAAKGLHAWTAGDVETAASQFAAAIGADASLVEAHSALAELAHERGAFSEAASVLERAIAADRGYAPFRLARASAFTGLADEARRHAQDAMPHYEAAVGEYTHLLARVPDSIAALRARGAAFGNRGFEEFRRGEDPGASFARALEDFDAVLRLDPNDHDALANQGKVHFASGEWSRRRGQDPTDAFAAAEGAASSALDLAPRLHDAWALRAATRVNWALHVHAGGRDPTSLLESAITDFSMGLQLDPHEAHTWAQRATARSHLAQARASVGASSDLMFESAIADSDQSLQIDPASLDAWCQRAGVWMRWGDVLSRGGQDPTTKYRESVRSADEALARHPTLPEAWCRRGQSLVNLGLHQQRSGAPAQDSYRAAIASFDHAIAAAADDLFGGHRDRGGARVNLAQCRQVSIAERLVAIQAARHDLDIAVRLAPGDVQAWLFRGNASWTWSALLAAPEERAMLLKDAVQSFSAIIESQPQHRAALSSRSRARAAMADQLSERGEDASGWFAGAVEDLRTLVEIQPAHEASRIELGGCFVNWGNALQRRAVDPSDRYAAAAEVLEEVLHRSPSSATAWEFRGNAHLGVARWRATQGGDCASAFKAALDCFGAAIRIDPQREPKLRECVAWCRKRLAALGG